MPNLSTLTDQQLLGTFQMQRLAGLAARSAGDNDKAYEIARDLMRYVAEIRLRQELKAINAA